MAMRVLAAKPRAQTRPRLARPSLAAQAMEAKPVVVVMPQRRRAVPTVR